MGGSLNGPYLYTVSQEEVQAYEREVEGYKSHIKNTIQFTNKKGLKGRSDNLPVCSLHADLWFREAKFPIRQLHAASD